MNPSASFYTAGGAYGMSMRPSPRTRRLVAATLLATLCTACSTVRGPSSDTVLTKESVVKFMNRFEEIAEKENFDLIQDMVHDDAFFRFSDGDFVGKKSVRAAFEKTWKGNPSVKKASFFLTDIQVLSLDAKSASATYTYNWEGVMDGKSFRIQGRGTRVLVVESGRIQIIHEHLSRYPR